MRGARRVAGAGIAWMCVLACSGVVAGAQASQPYFTALPASGATQLTALRYGALAARLPDGRVLIAGGDAVLGAGADQRSAEIFDPATGLFTALPASGSTQLATARTGAVAAPLADGRILIAGGTNNGLYQRSAELFDPATGTFTALPASGATQLTVARGRAASATLADGRVLIAGGDSGNGLLRSAELFDPAAGTFTALPAAGATQLTVERDGLAGIGLPNGTVLFAAGFTYAGDTTSAELFDPVAGTFTALPATGATQLAAARTEPSAVALADGRVLVAGGGLGPGVLRSAELFDPASGTFSALPASGTTQLTTARQGAAEASLPDGRVLIAGGYDGVGLLRSAELFVPAPRARVAGGDFGAQTVGRPAAAQTLVVTNLGAQALTLGSSAIGPGPQAADFAIVADACAGQVLAFRQTCTLTVRFTPTAAGTRSASIVLASNEPTPSAIALSGSGVAADAGPAGAAGPQGARGAGEPGPPGARGPAGRDGRATCVVKQVGKRVKVTCTLKLATATPARARLTRRGQVVARGRRTSAGRLVLVAGRRLRPGIYRLVVGGTVIAVRVR